MIDKRLIAKARKSYQMQLEVKESISHLNGKIVVIPKGKYRGRLGKVKHLQVDYEGEIISIINPYSLVGDELDTLSDHIDTRTYWNVEEVEVITQKLTVALVREYGRRAKND